MLRFADARGSMHHLAAEPQRIVSLVPSDTYNLFALGAGERVVGRTVYCVDPAGVEAIETVGGTKNADVDRILALAPDVVLANQEENRRVDVERLEAAGLTVLVSFPKTVAAGLEHAAALAALFPSLSTDAVLAKGRADYERLCTAAEAPVPTFLPIWMDPLMTVHADTFISDVLELCGGRNVFSDRRRRYPLAADLGRREAVAKPGRDDRYPRVTMEEVQARAPKLVLLPDEPHDFSEADAEVFRAALGSETQVVRCNGRDLMWYGLRCLEGLTTVADHIAAAKP